MVDFLWNLWQHRQIREVGNDARHAGADARSAALGLSEMAAALDRLALTCEAMWELLREKTALSQDELLAKIREVDLRDGRLDGKHRPVPTHCPECARANNPRHARCLYCGAQLAGGSAPFHGG